MQNEKIFSLDIGTRTVVGIILEQIDDHYRVVDHIVYEHKERAMQDGQIHDIAAVAEVIATIKQELEIKHGPLPKVCVAAAGRSLKTERAKANIDITGKPLLTQEDIIYLELTAVQYAQAKAAEQQVQEKISISSYYCVGYSVLHYFIDGEIIGNLIDQQGSEASVEIIATFLPRAVVNSLLKALERAGLELEALTLEPIAAINVLVPVSMRRLNVALVDIGAGTSDIAITNEGTVVAYGMVPVAGDEITEAISDELLLDFPEAEQAKKDLWEHSAIKVQDILGFENEMDKDEVVAQIDPAIEKLANEISSEIKHLNNNKSPKAIMLVGGGSKTPELPQRLAKNLDLPENRVAIRGADAIQGLTFEEHIPVGPENITPIGIAISARKSPIHYVTVTVNDQPIRMFEVKSLTVADCLLASGISIQKLYGKPGMATFITLNNQQLTIPGTFGEPPVLLKNGKDCLVEDPIEDGDRLTVTAGKDGVPSNIQIKDLIDEIPATKVIINEQEYNVQTSIIQNGVKTTNETFIQDRDHIQVQFPETIEELLKQLQLFELIHLMQPFKIFVNDKEMFLPNFTGTITLNGKPAKLTDRLPSILKLTIARKLEPTAQNLATILQQSMKRSITVFFNDQPISLTKKVTSYERNGEILQKEDKLEPGDQITFAEEYNTDFIFQDVFKYVDIEKPADSNGHFTLLVNKQEATFYTPIQEGDKLIIDWSFSTNQMK